MTRTNRWGSEAILSLVDGKSAVNQPFNAVVQSLMIIDSSITGNTKIASQHIVLSGHGQADTWLKKNLSLGDTVEIQIRLQPIQERLLSLVGGTPRLIRDGKLSIEWEQEGLSESFSTTRHPRTAIGINADSSMLYFVVADGRQPGYSEGMSLPELTNYMLSLDIFQAINLDGGGSSAFLLRDKVANRPSDNGGERAVANLLAVFNQAKHTRTKELLFDPPQISTVVKSPFRFKVTARDSNYHEKVVHHRELQFKYDQKAIAQLKSGHWILSGGLSPQWIEVHYDGVSGKIPVYTEIIEYLEATPAKIQLYTGKSRQISVKAMNKQDEEILATPNIYHWKYNPEDLEISETGIIKGLQPSQGEIILRSSQSSLEIPYQIVEPDTILYDYFSAGESFQLQPLNGEIQSIQFAENSLHCSYYFMEKERSFLYINRTQSIPSTSSDLLLDIEAAPANHGFRAAFSDSEGNKFYVSLDEKIDPTNNKWQTIHLSLGELLPQWTNPGVSAVAPLSLQGFYLFQGDENKKGAGAIAFRQLRIVQPLTSLAQKHFNWVCETELLLFETEEGLQLIKMDEEEKF